MKKIHITRLVVAAGMTGALAIASTAMADEQKAATQQVVVKFIKATPEQIARHGGGSTQANAGMRAYVDADTKQFRAATQAELNEAAARATAPAAARRSTAFAAEAAKVGPVPETLATGTKKMVLDESYLSYAVATVGPDGKARQACVDQQPNQQAALEAAAKVGVDSHEK